MCLLISSELSQSWCLIVLPCWWWQIVQKPWCWFLPHMPDSVLSYSSWIAQLVWEFPLLIIFFVVSHFCDAGHYWLYDIYIWCKLQVGWLQMIRKYLCNWRSFSMTMRFTTNLWSRKMDKDLPSVALGTFAPLIISFRVSTMAGKVFLTARQAESWHAHIVGPHHFPSCFPL